MIPSNLVRLTILGKTYHNVNGRLVPEAETAAPASEPTFAPIRLDAGSDGHAEQQSPMEADTRPRRTSTDDSAREVGHLIDSSNRRRKTHHEHYNSWLGATPTRSFALR